MDPNLMNDAQMATIIVLVVAALRDRFPKIDGLLVLLVATVVGVGLSELAGGIGWRPIITRGIVVAASTCGGLKGLTYVAGKLPGSVAAVVAPQDEIPVHDASERGVARLGVIGAVAALALVVFVFARALTGCAAVQTGCQVVHVADQTCDLITFEMPDGGRTQVSRAELARAGERTAMALRATDAGADR